VKLGVRDGLGTSWSGYELTRVRADWHPYIPKNSMRSIAGYFARQDSCNKIKEMVICTYGTVNNVAAIRTSLQKCE